MQQTLPQPTTRGGIRCRVTFTRIGHRRSVPPLDVRVTDTEDLAVRILGYARAYLWVREVEIVIDPAATSGRILYHRRNGGEFLIEATGQPAQVEPRGEDRTMMRDLNGPAPLVGPPVGYCGCCGEYVTAGHHVDDLAATR